MQFILKITAVAMTLLLSAATFSGITVVSLGPAVVAALVLGLFNALLRPVLLLLTLPINLLTLGLFTFVINALLLWLTASLISGVAIAGFWSAFVVALLVSLVTSLIDSLDNE
jgi:putative membrane protein